MYFDWTVLPDKKRLNLEVASKRLIHPVPCHAWKCIPTGIFGGPGCNLLQQMISQRKSQKLLQGLVSHKLPYFIEITLFVCTSRIHLLNLK